MKVVHVLTTLEGGAGLCAARIIKATRECGVDARAVVAKGISSEYVSVIPFEYPWSRNWLVRQVQRVLRILKIWPRSLKYTKKIVKERTLYKDGCFTSPLTTYIHIADHPWIRKADIVHLHWIGEFVDYPSFFSKVSKPIVWTIHDENPGYGGFHYTLWREAAPNSFKQLDEDLARIKKKAYQTAKSIHLVALSNKMADFFRSNYLLQDYPIVKIYNGVDIDSFTAIPRSLARQVLSIPEDKTVFLFTAYNLEEGRKGLNELIAALEQLQNSNTLLICLGHFKKIPSTSFDIRCEGFISNTRLLSIYYSAADFFMLPSYQEAFAQTPLESMACGVPVIAFPCSGAKDLINIKNGIVCEDFSVEALKKGILMAMERHYDKNFIIEDLFHRFSYNKIAEQYLALYKDIKNGSS